MSARLLLLGSAFLVASCATAQENPNYQHSTKFGQTQMASHNTVTPYTSSQIQTTQAAVYTDNLNQFDPQTGAQTHAASTVQSLTHTHATQSGRSLTHTHAMEAGHSMTLAHTIDSGQVNANYVGNEGATIPAAHPVQNNTSPTERSYDTNQMQGTPGYEMMRAQQQTPPAPTYPSGPATDYTPYTPPVAAAPAPRRPQPVPYDYGQNMIISENTPANAQAPVAGGAYDRGRVGTAANIATGQSYIVRQGDTVYSLSRRLCAPIPEITAPNGIDGSYAISIGQTLYLPNSRCP